MVCWSLFGIRWWKGRFQSGSNRSGSIASSSKRRISGGNLPRSDVGMGHSLKALQFSHKYHRGDEGTITLHKFYTHIRAYRWEGWLHTPDDVQMMWSSSQNKRDMHIPSESMGKSETENFNTISKLTSDRIGSTMQLATNMQLFTLFLLKMIEHSIDINRHRRGLVRRGRLDECDVISIFYTLQITKIYCAHEGSKQG